MQDDFKHRERFRSWGVQDPLPLATIVHISDLHFGKRIRNDEREMTRMLAQLPWAHGLCGHSYQAAKSLDIRVRQVFEDRNRRGVPCQLVFTGDLTRSGHEHEFLTGTTFLRGRYYAGARLPFGLNLGERVFAVPGNHDIWKRRDPRSLGAYRRHFPDALPNRLEIPNPTRKVVLYGLDSTQNVEILHKLARGRIDSQELDSVVEWLEAEAKNNSIQIVCLHHPVSDAPGTSADLALALDNRSSIAAKLATAGADLILAGHLHRWFTVDGNETMPAQAVVGTATQQFSERSFFVLDIFEHTIQLVAFEFDKEQLQFVPASLHFYRLHRRTSRSNQVVSQV